jgi:hypothetical protein
MMVFEIVVGRMTDKDLSTVSGVRVHHLKNLLHVQFLFQSRSLVRQVLWVAQVFFFLVLDAQTELVVKMILLLSFRKSE